MIDVIELLMLSLILVMVARTAITPKSRNGRSPKIVMDTSGLIDGRVIELAQSGFVTQEIIVAQFILQELQLLADGKDSRKRERARFGLDVIKNLQDIKGINLTIDRSPVSAKLTDDKLVELAKKLSASLYTTDFNLNKVAAVEGVKVLNVNELAHNLRATALPGEKLQVKIVQIGSSKNQGVGYADDGTMVVVEDASKLMGKMVEVEVDRMHQTLAGKMIFAHLIR